MKATNARTVVSNAYLDYGTYVNKYRSLPDINDGLKSVQRRLILAGVEAGAGSSIVKSAKIVGYALSKYHPHGDSSVYGALVSMINHQHPLFKGKGNFGYKGLISTGPAAMRYTGASLTPLATDIFLPLKNYAPTYENDLYNKEPEYLPTPIPYALLNGATGIGIGISTNIPQIDVKSLRKEIFNIINGKPIGDIKLAPLGDGSIEADDENYESLMLQGHGQVTVRANVVKEWDKSVGRYATVVTNVPNYMSYGRIHAILRNEFENQLVYLRDDSQEETRISIIRNHNVRKISDNEIFEKVKYAMSRKVTFRCIVSNNGVATKIGIKDWLSHCVTTTLRCYESQLQDKLDKLNLDLKFYEVREQLVKYLINGTDHNEIKKKIKLTDTELSYCLQKSVRNLSKDEADKVLCAKSDVESAIRNSTDAYGQHIFRKF